MPYLIYLRKSRKDDEYGAQDEADVLARHETILLELAKRMRLLIGDTYREVKSGDSIAARPVMQRLLSEVEQGLWEGVLVVEVERLARGDTVDQGIVAQTFQYSGTQIITPAKTYDPANEFDREYFEFGLFMSRREYNTIKRRLNNGRVASAKAGLFVGNRPPYGYRRKKLEGQKGWVLEPHETQFAVASLLFDLLADGEGQPDGTVREYTVDSLADHLNELAIPAYSGGVWTASSVREVVSNPVHIGLSRWGRRPQTKKMVDGEVVITRPRQKEEDIVVAAGSHPPSTTREKWEAVQAKIHTGQPRVRDSCTVQNPLAGLVVCGVCGHRMQRRPYQADSPDFLICTHKPCSNISANLYLVEEAVLEALQEWVTTYQTTSRRAADNSGRQLDIKRRAIEAAQKDLAKLDTQIDSLYDLLEQGVYSKDVFQTRSRALAKRKAEKEAALAKLQGEIAEHDVTVQTAAELLPAAENVVATYFATDDPATRNRLLKSVLDKVVYTKTEKGDRRGPGQFQITLFPKLPQG